MNSGCGRKSSKIIDGGRIWEENGQGFGLDTERESCGPQLCTSLRASLRDDGITADEKEVSQARICRQNGIRERYEL